MAQRALPPGTVQRRTIFGLLDADGWTAAFLKAMAWFAIILFLLGYVPNAAYKLTTFNQVDLGANLISPINFCDGSNLDLPCPAPPGAVVPWSSSPAQIALPEPRRDAVALQSGTNLYLIGGRTAGGATASVLGTTTTSDGNFGSWTKAPALPEPRSDAALAIFSGVPHVLGGLDAAGKPTDTVFVGTIDKGKLTGWTASAVLRLPVPLSGASAVVDANGVWLVGGRTGAGFSAAIYRSSIDRTAKPPKLTAWVDRPELTMRTHEGVVNGRADAVVSVVGERLFIAGGETALGPTGEVLRVVLDKDGGTVSAGGTTSLPEVRVDAAGFANNGALYVIGGLDAAGAPTRTTYSAVPDALSGEFREWQRLEVDDLPGPLAGAASAVVGAHAFVIGGSDGRTDQAGSYRANLAPRTPFFRLGLLGVTIPGLAIKGEIGIQLGEIFAATLGVIDFILLCALGVIVQRPRLRARTLHFITRGRYRLPSEDLYSD